MLDCTGATLQANPTETGDDSKVDATVQSGKLRLGWVAHPKCPNRICNASQMRSAASTPLAHRASKPTTQNPQNKTNTHTHTLRARNSKNN